MAGDRESLPLLELESFDDADLRLGFLLEFFAGERFLAELLRDLDLLFALVDLKRIIVEERTGLKIYSHRILKTTKKN